MLLIGNLSTVYNWGHQRVVYLAILFCFWKGNRCEKVQMIVKKE